MTAVLTRPTYTATQNACKLCAPLGACLAFRGLENSMTLLHGSQGCATYIRRYMIGHYREPVDVASSSFGERSAIFGGAEILQKGLRNVIKQYQPRVIGVASTCLSETIGDDLHMLTRQFMESNPDPDTPIIIPVSTPSYKWTHAEGFHATVRGIVDRLVLSGGYSQRPKLNILPGILSAADLRYLKEILGGFDVEYTILPDYSDTLDGPVAAEYAPIPPGGTRLKDIAQMAQAVATITFGSTLKSYHSAGALLAERYAVPEKMVGIPIGVKQTDAFFKTMEEITGQGMPAAHAIERGRLIDAYVDGHKYVFGKRAVVYGEEDLVVGLAAFLAEIGIVPVICASGGRSGLLKESVQGCLDDRFDEMVVLEGADFVTIAEAAKEMRPDFFIGNSDGYAMVREFGLPLVRAGFPVHDRLGGQRLLHIGYRGAQQLFDRITDELLRKLQDDSPVGYTHY